MAEKTFNVPDLGTELSNIVQKQLRFVKEGNFSKTITVFTPKYTIAPNSWVLMTFEMYNSATITNAYLTYPFIVDDTYSQNGLSHNISVMFQVNGTISIDRGETEGVILISYWTTDPKTA